MLNGAHTSLTASDDGTTKSIDNVFSESLDYGAAFKVDTFKLNAMVFGSRIKRGFNIQAGVQTFTGYRECAF